MGLYTRILVSSISISDKRGYPDFILACNISRGVTIHRKYGSPRYEAGGSVHGPFFGNFG